MYKVGAFSCPPNLLKDTLMPGNKRGEKSATYCHVAAVAPAVSDLDVIF